MSSRYIGGIVTKNPTALNPALGNSANGIFTLDQYVHQKSAGTWPAFDPYYDFVTLNLHGNGTNGAQNNTFLDSSTNNFSITRNGNTTQGTFSPYGSNWSNYFDGTGDFFTWTGANCNGGTWTLEAWIFPTANGGGSFGGRGIISCGDVFLNMGFDGSNKITLRWYTGTTGYSISSTTVLSLNTWYHVAVTWQSGTSAKVFVNGVLENSTASNLSIASSTSWQIGREGAQTSYFTGYISNARVSSAILYSSNFTPPTAPFTVGANTNTLTCQSNRFIDNSTNAYALTPAGNTSVQRFSPFAPTSAYSTSVIGGSGYFDGSGDYLNTPTSGQFAPTGNFTVSFWYYPTTLNTYNTVIGNYTSTASTDWFIEFTSNGSVNVYTNGGTVRITGGAGTIKSGQWSFVTLSRSGTTITFKVNGTSVGTYTQSGTFGSASKTIYVGQYFTGSEYITGYLSDVRLIDGSEVTTIPTSPLTAVSGTNLLLNFTNAGILDNAMMNNLETVGNAQISTSVKKYGTGSMAFDGSGDYLDSTGGTVNALGSGDWTIEFWVYFNALTGTNIIDYRSASVLSNTLAINYSSGMQLYVNNSTTAIQGSALSTSTWYHVAVCKFGSSTKMFVNGTQAGSTYTDTNNYVAGANRPRIGSGGDAVGNYLNGYVDDLRITKGYARYTANFTPPTSQLPDQ